MRFRKWAAAILVGFLLILPVRSVSGAASGPASAIVGDTVTVSFSFSDMSWDQITGKIAYDRQQLEILSLEPTPGWSAEYLQTDFVLRWQGSGAAVGFTAKLLVKNVPVGTKVTIRLEDIFATTDGVEEGLDAVVYTLTVAAPPSGDCAIHALVLPQGQLQPQFHPEVTRYSITVPFSVADLDVQAQTAETAQLDISSTALLPGQVTNVYLTVTAENGSQRVYTLAVTRCSAEEAQPSDSATESTEPASAARPLTQPDISGSGKDTSVPGWVIVTAILAGAAVGIACGMFLGKGAGKGQSDS